jgi:hypothetical protein
MTGGIQTSGGLRSPKILGEISGSNLSYVAAAATFTSLSYANNGGKVQLSSAGVHGLTTSPAVGNRVYVSWSGGTGVSGFYNILTVDTTLAITIDLTYAVGLGTPTVALAGTGATLTETLTVSANAMGANGRIEIAAMVEVVASTNQKLVQTLFGGPTFNLVNTSGATISASTMRQLIANNNSASAQKCNGVNNFGNTANVFVTGATDTSQSVTIAFRLTPAAANEPIRIIHLGAVLYASN